MPECRPGTIFRGRQAWEYFAMIARMRIFLLLLVVCAWQSPAFGQCAPGPDSPYFFRDLAEKRAEARIAEDRAFFDGLLSDAFAAKGVDGRPLSKQDFIAAELAGRGASMRRPFFAISNYTLIEHRQGYTVASYVLREGTTGDGETHLIETRVHEVYEVQGGRWRLASVESAALDVAGPAAQALR